MAQKRAEVLLALRSKIACKNYVGPNEQTFLNLPY